MPSHTNDTNDASVSVKVEAIPAPPGSEVVDDADSEVTSFEGSYEIAHLRRKPTSIPDRLKHTDTQPVKEWVGKLDKVHYSWRSAWEARRREMREKNE